jgi:hypothetical protein
MSNLTFPALPVVEGEPVHGASFQTTVHEAESGKEIRDSWAMAPRRRFRFTVVVSDGQMAPGSWSAMTELEVVEYFFEAHRGRWDSFLWVRKGVTHRVRFADDELEYREVGGGVFEIDLEFVSVL